MSLLPGRFYLDNFFDDFDTDKKMINMNCDIYEHKGKYNIVIDIPGFDKNDIKIDVEDGYLTIEATRKIENDESDDKHYIKRERFYGSFKRQFYIGDVDHENIEAEFKDGTLKVIVPKTEEKITKKSIEIK